MVVGLLRDPEFAGHLSGRLALGQCDLRLANLPDNLLRRVARPTHLVSPFLDSSSLYPLRGWIDLRGAGQ